MTKWRSFFSGNNDLLVVALVMGVLVILFAPIPAALLDFLILLNIALALLVLLITFYAPRPADFSTFPAMLLIATLFRLGLNVSATRLILSEGDAGRVITAVGTYVVGGNYIIGFIVFLILVIVQYVVVTSGAQRVSEVAARFTLDSMPGQQMSIDADLNMGFITQDEAKTRRKTLEREAAFYGAMDGASKFVKGDAIAGIVIMLINVAGGLIVGVLQQGMPWGEALRHFTLLTIGDGIVTQIPALVISVGTGLIVTRSASDGELGSEVVRQLSAFPRALAVVVCVMVGVASLPAMPVVPVLVIAAAVGLGYVVSRRSKGTTLPAEQSAPPAVDDLYTVYDVESIDVELGRRIAQHVGGTQGVLIERFSAFRAQLAQDTGFIVPKVRFRESSAIDESGYRISIFGDSVGNGQVQTDKMLAIHPQGDVKSIRGSEAREPTYGLPALWIDVADREIARAKSYTLVDPSTVLFTHLCELIRRHLADLLTRAETETMLGRVRANHPGLVEELVPTVLTVSDVQKVLQNLLKEKVAVRNLPAIVEALIDGARFSKDPGALTEHVRQRLAFSICSSLSSDRRVLHVMTLDPSVEDRLLATSAEAPPAVLVDPRWIDGVLLRIASGAERMLKSNLIPVILCAPELRRRLRALCERATPHLRVISVAEVPDGFELRAHSSITSS